jgi:DNA-binding NarL/FixJ family response regulator
MAHDRIKLLLIEDNALEAEVVRAMLRKAPHFELESVDSLAAGLDRLEAGDIQIVLLDADLPDSTVTKDLSALREVAGEIPVIALSGSRDEDEALETLRAGAQDYLVVGQLDGDALVRAARYAIERHRWLFPPKRAAAQQDGEDGERRGSDSFGPGRQPRAPLPAPSFLSAGMRVAAKTLSLREYAPERFGALVREYRELLDQALEARAVSGGHDSERLCRLAESFGNLCAGGRDVIEVTRTALTVQTAEASPEDLRGYTEEGRFLLLELMGHLVSYYRELSGAKSPIA